MLTRGQGAEGHQVIIDFAVAVFGEYFVVPATFTTFIVLTSFL